MLETGNTVADYIEVEEPCEKCHGTGAVEHDRDDVSTLIFLTCEEKLSKAKKLVKEWKLNNEFLPCQLCGGRGFFFERRGK